MDNNLIAKILHEIGVYLEMQEVPFKPRAYEKVAEVIDGLDEPVSEIYKKGGLKAVEDIPGVGLSIAEKIEELLKTGKLKYYEQLKKKMPVNLSELSKIEGLGPKGISKLYKKLSIKNMADLERAAKTGKISKLAGFGPKSEENILRGIGFAKSFGGRSILSSVMPEIRRIQDKLKALKNVKRVEVAGSIRRRRETVGDVDFLVISEKPKEIMNYFVSMPEVLKAYAHGDTKSMVKLKNGMDADLRVLPEESYGAALNYFTGSKTHNVALRQIAIKKGLTLNEYGLFKGTPEKKGKLVAGKSEEDIYKALGMDYIEPETREMTGEIEAAQKYQLPKLIKYGELKGDLQIQTNWTDGANSIEEMAEAAIKAGLEYIAITDHTKRLAMTNGLDEKRILKQMAEIDRLNLKLKTKNLKLRILKGSECDILKDGSMDLPDSILAKLDVVGASVHSLFNLTKEEQTARIIRAMRNPNVDILFHPTGRILQRREPYDLDMDEIIKTAKETGTILEINSSDRADLKDEYIRKCVEAGVKMSIDSDSHTANYFSVLEFGIAQARRGWAEKKDIINSWPVEKMLSFLKK